MSRTQGRVGRTPGQPAGLVRPDGQNLEEWTRAPRNRYRGTDVRPPNRPNLKPTRRAEIVSGTRPICDCPIDLFGALSMRIRAFSSRVVIFLGIMLASGLVTLWTGTTADCGDVPGPGRRSAELADESHRSPVSL